MKIIYYICSLHQNFYLQKEQKADSIFYFIRPLPQIKVDPKWVL